MKTANHTARPAALTSEFERTYGTFFDATIEAAGEAAPLMRDLNQVNTIMNGLGAVLRIVGSNAVLQDEFIPDDPETTAPFSRTTECALIAMAAAVCEQTRDYLELRSRTYNREASQ